MLLEESNRTFSNLLSNELFGSLDSNDSPTSSSRRQSASSSSHQQSYGPSTPSTPVTPRSKVFQFMPSPSPSISALSSNSYASVGLDSAAHEMYSCSPVKLDSQKILQSPRKNLRKIPKLPYKVLDAPDLADDYYLNLLDWSSTNILAVALASTVYIWMAETGQVMTLCNVRESENSHPNETVTSVAWVNKGSHLAVGLRTGLIQIWDVPAGKLLRIMTGHTNRTGSLAWSSHMLASGSRDKSVLVRDVRIRDQYVKRILGHKQEITGLCYNPSGEMLATGGNDNRLYVWDTNSYNYIHRYTEHEAAVKAISWNPHHRGILASGGGTSDRRILFWDTLKGDRHSIGDWDTGSQVCKLWFSKNTQELVSTHGYSGTTYQNHISIWKYPSMSQVATLTGHTYRVLYLAASPDGETIVTGSGDETIRFWRVFPPLKVDSRLVRNSNEKSINKYSEDSLLNIKKLIR